MASGVTRYGTRETLSVPALRKDGSTVSVEFTIQLLRDEAGTARRIVAAIEDISEHRKLEEAEKARERAEESAREQADMDSIGLMRARLGGAIA